MQLVQVEFAYPPNQRKLVWVDASWNLKPGSRVTFKDSCITWEVVKVYDTKIESEQISVKWGLDLPKSQRTER